MQTSFLRSWREAPQTGLRHPLTQGLLADPDPVTLGQLLARKRRAEVMIVGANQIQNRIAKGLRITPVPGRPRFFETSPSAPARS